MHHRPIYDNPRRTPEAVKTDRIIGIIMIIIIRFVYHAVAAGGQLMFDQTTHIGIMHDNEAQRVYFDPIRNQIHIKTYTHTDTSNKAKHTHHLDCHQPRSLLFVDCQPLNIKVRHGGNPTPLRPHNGFPLKRPEIAAGFTHRTARLMMITL